MAWGADEDWLGWAQRLRAIAQTGLAYSRDDYDLDRFREVQALAELMLASVTGETAPRVRGLFLAEQGYPTPKVDVRAGVFSATPDGRLEVLLVREAADGRWSLPGGWADEHDSPRESIEREVVEESGFRVRVNRLVAIKDRSLHAYVPRRLERIYKLFFLCDLEGGAAAPSLETTEAGFFPVDDLPALSLGRTLPDDVTMLAGCRADPGRPVYVD